VRIIFANGRDPVPSGISKWFCRDISQEVCPWNETFALPLTEEAFRARPAVAEKDTRALACDLLNMSQEYFSKAFKGSPMQRAKLSGLKRNAAIVARNIEPEQNAGGAVDTALHV
jgi:epoxyqueuosine reductase